MKKSLLTSIVCAGMLTAFGQNPYPTSGLRALYELDNSLANSASSSYNLTPMIGNVFTTTSDRTNTASKAMDRTNSDAFGNGSVTDNLTQFSIGAWVKLTSYTDATNTFSTIVSDLEYMFDETGWLQGSTGSYTLRVDENGNLQAILIGGSGTAYTILSSASPLQLNQWYQITWTVNQIEGESMLYVNGDLVDTETTLVTLDPPGNMEIGNVHRRNWDPNFNFYTNAEWQVFTGAIDELFIYESVLDTCDIKAIAEILPNFDISENNGSLTVTTSATASYAWYNCSTDQVVAGETSATFTPSDNAEYYAIVTDNCVSDTTACLAIAGSTNALTETLIEWSVYPNPANDVIQIDANNLERVTIIDMFGKTVVTSTSHLIHVEQLAAGTYTLQLTTTDGKSAMKRLMIQ